ncbi:MAG: hypothetical protein RI964_2086 [Pseudomonadota bacterium]|jgi:Na+-transporting NADH:ubiquinone oxidoreductase subunit NqrB
MGFDPRHYQLMVQASLLTWGISVLAFPITLWQVGGVLVAALATQWLCCRALQLPVVWLSTLNTSMSVLLLLHAQSVAWLAAAAALSIASKFVLRLGNRHIFNPSNFGIVVTLLMTSEVWAAPGQWGHGLWLFLLLAGSGLAVWVGWRTLLTTLSFIVAYISLVFLKAWWLGDPWAIPLHQLQNGSLLLFSFFMLSDPKTTPAHPIGKMIFGVSVAMLAAWLQFRAYLPNAFLYALLILSPVVFVLNRWLNYPSFEWSKSITKQEETA